LCLSFFVSSRRRHTSSTRDWSSDVCSSDLSPPGRLASEALLLGSCAVSAAAFWLLTGNPLGGLPRWLEATGHVFTGYTQTMATRSEERRVGKEGRARGRRAPGKR